MKNVIVWLEDRPGTVASQIQFCKKNGFDVRQEETLTSFLESLEENYDRLGLIILDIMIYSISSLESVGILNSDTDVGQKAGWIVLDRILRPDKSVNDHDKYKSIPVLIVSTRPLSQQDKTDCEILKKRGGCFH